jgi:hypothetical protein
MRMTRKSDGFAGDMEMSEAGFTEVRLLRICDISRLQTRNRHFVDFVAEKSSS